MSGPRRDRTKGAAWHPRRPSLRRRLLLFLLIPMLSALVLDAVVTYFVALAFANHVHDDDLADDALTVAKMLSQYSGHGEMSPQARFLLEYDPDGRDYFSVRSARHGMIEGSAGLPAPGVALKPGAAPVLHNSHFRGAALRSASIAIANPAQAGDTITITIAENMKARRRQARQILLLAVPLQAMLILALLLLVRFGVGSGLKVLDPLTQRLARRERDLTPIEDTDVPVELLPLTRTIDAVFARLRELIALHERFVADAAHQLRTPLTGLAMHVERALAHARESVVVEALQHIRAATGRVTRTSNQLLALARAQSPAIPDTKMRPIDLPDLLRGLIATRLQEAWQSNIDLGYEGPDSGLVIRGDAAALQEMIDNLIDNALHYTGHHGTVTVAAGHADGQQVFVRVEDDGPGVDAALLPRLGERFFRDPANREAGTGLGLAIVEHIARRHGARVLYAQSPLGGLRVEIRFPGEDAAP